MSKIGTREKEKKAGEDAAVERKESTRKEVIKGRCPQSDYLSG